MVTFDICQLLVTPGLFEYFCQNTGPSENQSFLDKGVTSGQRGLGVLGVQMTGLHDGTIFGTATHLMGCQEPLEKIAFFSTFATPSRILRIHWFYQESVHRCSLGCSSYLDVDSWIYSQLAICWAIKWQFLRCQKVALFFDPPNFGIWGINRHRCVTICKLEVLFFCRNKNHPFMAWRVDN